MTKEIRRLFFSYDEVREALLDYAKAYDLDMPIGKIVRIKFADADEAVIPDFVDFEQSAPTQDSQLNQKRQLTITFYAQEELEHQYFTLENNFVALALTAYCAKRGIPVAKNAKKSVGILGFYICLDFFHEYAAPEPEVPDFSFEE